MRVKPAASFPFPVLSEATADYEDQNFQINLSVTENPAAAHVELRGTLALVDLELLRLIETGDARVGLMVTCQGTYLDMFLPCGLGAIEVDLSGGQVRGRVNVRGVVVTARDDVNLLSPSIVDEFPASSKRVKVGSFIALTNEVRFEAGLDKLAPLESIFRLKRSEETPDDTVEVGLDSEAIELRAAPALYEMLYNLREQSAVKDVLIPALFLPAVMSVLDTMRTGEFEGRRWRVVLSARCEAEGINLKNDELLTSAQRLLGNPLMVLKRIVEGVA
jgi:hypothetical protein